MSGFAGNIPPGPTLSGGRTRSKRKNKKTRRSRYGKASTLKRLY
jgi:hypothetical protein